MNYVYLPELDSVCNSKDELEYAMQLLYDEIVIKGNVVVLTFNQFTDSYLFYSVIADDRMRKVFETLFQHKRLAISKFQFNGIVYDNVIKYIHTKIIDTLNKSKTDSFIFSLLNLGNSLSHIAKTKILNEFSRALMYNDIATLRSELNKLSCLPNTKVKLLCNYIDFLLKISTQQIEYLDVIHNRSASMADYLETITSKAFQNFGCFSVPSALSKIVKPILSQSKDVTRSQIYHAIQTQCPWMSLQLMPIVDLCYNATNARSISVLKVINSNINHINDIYANLSKQTSQGKSSLQMRQEAIQNNCLGYFLPFNSNVVLEWESAVRIIHAFDVEKQNAPHISWILFAKNYKRRIARRVLIRFLLTLTGLFLVNLFIASLFEKLNTPKPTKSIKAVIAFIGAILSIFISEYFSYILDFTNIFKILRDEECKHDKETCKRIVEGCL